MQSLAKAIIIFVSALSFTQCRIAECTVTMADVNIEGWDEEITVPYINKDTTVNYNLNFTLHVNRKFEATELDVEITTMTPDSLRYTERVILPVDVAWSNRTISTTDISIPYRHNVRLRRMGEYKITITPHRDVVGVEAAGINFQSQK